VKYKRKVILIGIVLAAAALIVFSYYLWCVGGIVGYLSGKLSAGKGTGIRGRVKSIVFPISSYQFHLHHWFLAVIALIVCVVADLYVITPQLFYGSMAGLALQGIFCYDDWFRLVRKNAH